MNDAFSSYLERIGQDNASVTRRVSAFVDVSEELTGEVAVDLLLEDYVDASGARTLTDLNVFTESHLVSFVNFMNEDDMFLMSLRTEPLSCRIAKTEYTFGQASPQSKLSVDLRFRDSPDVGARFTATGLNCDALMELVRKYFLRRT